MRSGFHIWLGFALALPASAQMKVQTIHVHVLNGRSGKPVPRARATVNVFPLSNYETPTNFIADGHGEFSMLVLTTAGISTAVTQHWPCQHLTKAERKQPPARYLVEQILTTGVLSPDTCGKPAQTPQPGVLTLYVRPAHWWQRF